MVTILHITEALGGGVAVALAGYITNSPTHRHVLLASLRPQDKLDIFWEGMLDASHDMPRNHIQAIRNIRRIYKQLAPDWVHLHSSFAGAWGRLAGIPANKVIYSPHCYAFERQDIAWPLRKLFWITEKALSWRCARIAAGSPHEARLSQRLRHDAKIFDLPLHVHVTEDLKKPRRLPKPDTTPRIAMVGRLVPQKDPRFFLEVVRRFRALGGRAQFVWLGGGDPLWEKILRQEGVEVSGWISDRASLLSHIAACDIYFHSAAWETGCSISALEAALLGLALVFREIPSLEGLPLPLKAKTPCGIAGVLLRLVAEKDWTRHLECNKKLCDLSSPERQAESLKLLYAPP